MKFLENKGLVGFGSMVLGWCLSFCRFLLGCWLDFVAFFGGGYHFFLHLFNWLSKKPGESIIEFLWQLLILLPQWLNFIFFWVGFPTKND